MEGSDCRRIGNQSDATRVSNIMRSVLCAAAVIFVTCNVAGFAETKIPCGQTLSRPLQSRAELVIDSKPAGLQIVGSDDEAIHVSCTANDDETARDVALHFSPTAKGGKLSIEGALSRHGNNGIAVKIEVPRRTNLSIRMPAGQVKVEEVKGDKDIALMAGQITISSIHDGDYRSVDASVGVGEVNASAFGANKGGFFRSFTKKNLNGDYRLQAHVTTGQIDLAGNAEQRGSGAKPD
jgi:hypothetical protein